MEQLTLEEKALDYSKQFWSSEEKRNSLTDFKAGAEWQYEQSKELINIMRRLLSAYDFRFSPPK